MCANIFLLYGYLKLTGAQVRRLAWWPNKPLLNIPDMILQDEMSCVMRKDAFGVSNQV